MSLILCRQEPVTVPYFVEELGIHLYSSQELCYVIFNHPFLVMEDFVDERLTAFLRSELRMPFLAERIEKWIQSRGTSDELLFLILQDCAYYTQQEQARYRQELSILRKLPAEEYEKRRADYFYSRGLYGKAAGLYEKILESGKGKALSPEFKAKLWNNIAACYTKLFCYQKAMHAYDCAWNEKENPDFVKRMYFLSRMQPDIEIKERFLAMMTEEDRMSWDEEVREAAEASKNETPVVRLSQMFEKDPIKRIAGASEVLNQWKLEYRKMI